MSTDRFPEPRHIRLCRDEAEFIVDCLEGTGIPQWMQLAAEIREHWGMDPFPAGTKQAP